MDSTKIGFTVTTHSPDLLLPSCEVAFIFVVPAVRAFTLPLFSFTVAMEGLSELHVTVFTAAFSGNTVNCRSFVSPICSSAAAGETETDVTLTSSTHTAFSVISALPIV